MKINAWVVEFELDDQEYPHGLIFNGVDLGDYPLFEISLVPESASHPQIIEDAVRRFCATRYGFSHCESRVREMFHISVAGRI